MDCDEIKKILPKYFQHQADDDEIKTVEEHLCVCHDCRAALGEIMDKLSDAEPTQQDSQSPDEIQIVSEPPPLEQLTPKPNLKPLEDNASPDQAKNQEEPKPTPEDKQTMEYFPGKDLETSPNDLKAQMPQEKSKDESGAPMEKPKPAEPQIPEPPAQPEPPAETEPVIEPDAKGGPAFQPQPPTPKEPEPIETTSSQPAFEPSETMSPLPEEKEMTPSRPTRQKPPQFSLEGEGEYSLDNSPLENKKTGIVEYAAVAIGIAILGILIFLLLKG